MPSNNLCSGKNWRWIACSCLNIGDNIMLKAECTCVFLRECCDVGFDDTRSMDVRLSPMHYVGATARFSASASSPPQKPRNTWIWSLGINFLLVKFYLYLPKGLHTQGLSVKVAEEGDAALRFAAGAHSFSPLMSHRSASLTLLLCFLPFFMLFLFPSFFPPLLPVKRKRWHLGCSAASTVSSFFYFSCVRGGWYRKQETEWEKQKSAPPSVSYPCYPPLALSTFIGLTFIPLLLFLLIPLFSSLFSSYLCLSLLVDNADMPPRTLACTHTHTHTGARKDGIRGSSRLKACLLNHLETVSNCESIVTALSI